MYIYEYENWTHFTYDSKEISALLENCHIAQGRLLSKMEALGLSQKEDKILESISADVIKSSEIEGFLLNKEQVRSSIARRLGLQKQIAVNTDRNVDAVVEMMLDATQNYEKPLTKERLFAWHACLFPTGYSGMNKIEVAQYRSGAMQVVSGAIGMEKVHYEAPAAEKIPEEMEVFLDWLNNESKSGDSLVNAAIAHLWFVTLHPFEDGNGRVARLLMNFVFIACRTRFLSTKKITTMSLNAPSTAHRILQNGLSGSWAVCKKHWTQATSKQKMSSENIRSAKVLAAFSSIHDKALCLKNSPTATGSEFSIHQNGRKSQNAQATRLFETSRI